MTEKQLELFERYQHIVPEKIAKCAPEYVDDEDFRQDAFVHLMEYIIKKSDVFEQTSRSVVTSSIHRSLDSFIRAHCRQIEKRQIEKENLSICSYGDIDDLKDNYASFSEDVDKSMVNYYIAKSMSTLDAEEQFVLVIRFGFLGRTVSLDDTGWVFGVPRERIRQIENKAIRKLQHPSRIKYLVDFYK